MKYFMDTHDRTKGSFPAEELAEEQFFAQFDALEKAAPIHVRAERRSHPESPRGHRLPVRLHHGSQAGDRRRHAAVKGCSSDETVMGG
jgi:hypothetical protein